MGVWRSRQEETVGIWRCRRQAVGYQEVQKANSGCLEVHKAGSGYLEVQEEGCLHRTVKKIDVMILSRPFLVPFLVPVFLLSQVPRDATSRMASGQNTGIIEKRKRPGQERILTCLIIAV